MGTQQEQIRHNKTGEAKLNIMHTGQENVRIKQETDRDQPQDSMGNTHTH